MILASVMLFCGIASAQDYVVPVETWDYEEINGSNYHGYSFHESWPERYFWKHTFSLANVPSVT